jgi:hypothetical protein
MNDPNLGPLPSDIARLLEAEKSRAPESVERTDRVLEHVRASLTNPAPGGGGGDGGADPSEPPPGAPRGAPLPLIGAKLGGALAVAATVGAIGGAVGHARLAPAPHQEGVTACAPSAQDSSNAPVVGPAVDEIESRIAAEKGDASLTKPSVAAVAPPPSTSTTVGLMPRDLDLAKERSLIDMARSALARGSSAAAISALRDHESAFPRGRLSEEREALWVQVLASSGQRAQAVRRAAAFHRQFPNSMLAPAVEAAVSTSDTDALP